MILRREFLQLRTEGRVVNKFSSPPTERCGSNFYSGFSIGYIIPVYTYARAFFSLFVGIFITVTTLIPASANRWNESNLNQAGTYGIYWSSSANGMNGRNMDFNLNGGGDGNVNPDNWNNRQNGFPVRCVAAFIFHLGLC
jgi:Fibrobacter succinogenes major domain (Fib_succ_major).